jgi:cardiolipin synthase C
VKVRVIVDDLLIDAPPDSMLALALHPNIDIRIYNPRLNVGTSKLKKMSNVATGLRTVNQRMHDKTALFDGLAGITGGRNMADEYFDYNHTYNFRDRDMLLLGPVVTDMQASFQRFWDSEQAVPVEKLLPKQMKRMTPERAGQVYAGLHAYAAKQENFAPEVRQALMDLPTKFERLSRDMVWDQVNFLSDLPGKNSARYRFDGGGRTTSALANELKKAQKSVVIQSPYLVMPKGALAIFRELVKRGVEVRIVTNSLASTDNLQAFSGYQKQRASILNSGVKVFEYKPDPAIKRELIERYPTLEKQSPVFAIHAKSMVIDSKTLYVGTFNLDPRSANLNTEVGALLHNAELARQVERNIIRDMAPENSWNAAEKADRFAPPEKRRKLKIWKALPLEPFL